jgi:hypothetical protein
MFHDKRNKVLDKLEPTEASTGFTEELVGLDAKIRGGAFDSTRSGK